MNYRRLKCQAILFERLGNWISKYYNCI